MYGLKNVRNRQTDPLSRVGWERLESLLAIYYRGKGYRVDHVGTGASGTRFDGGIDLKLHKDDAYIVVQCKHWNAKQVPHNDVHQLLGIMVNEGATGAILVTSGEFTSYARESAAKQGHVQLVDGELLRSMIGPLPDVADTKGPPPARSAAARVATTTAAHVGERLLLAAEDRIRGGRRSRPVARSIASELIAKMVLLGLSALLVIGAFWMALNGISQALQPKPSPVQAAAQPSSWPVPVPQASGTGSVTQMPVAEPAFQAPPPPTREEVRESQRRADEAIRVLEATTPEM